MRKYLRELPHKPDHHKKQFALLASATVTLFIFAFWSVSMFGVSDDIVAQDNARTGEDRTSTEVGPFESFRMSLLASTGSILENFKEIKAGWSEMGRTIEYDR